MSWKDLFYFSKSQRTGIIILLSLIFIALLSTFLFPFIIKPKENVDNSGFMIQADKFRAELREKERKNNYQNDNYPDFYKPYSKKSFENTKYQLFTFDPNTADSADFVRLGLKPYIASNILKYRKKGGKFRNPVDFGKVYGIKPEKLNELIPYIQIQNQLKTEIAKSEIEVPSQKADKTQSFQSNKKDIIVELNSADTTTLMQIRGIGKFYAKGIIKYRQILGGYSSVEQLREVYGMRPENFEKIKPFCSTDLSLIRKMDVNKASIERLKNHPYLNFSKAKAIYEYRRKKVRLKNINDLKNLVELNADDLNKIEPYLSFE